MSRSRFSYGALHSWDILFFHISIVRSNGKTFPLHERTANSIETFV